MSDDIRRNMALFPIGIVMKLTDLTARQIRYYEQHELIMPARTCWQSTSIFLQRCRAIAGD